MMADVSILEVLLYGEPIGTLTRVAGDRNLFAFAEAYIEDTDRPVLGLAFKDQLGELITDHRTTQTRLMPFFSNLLPEGRLREYLAERAGVNPEREFFLLWMLGRDLPGAITVRPADGEAWPPVAGKALDADEQAAREARVMRFSLAGVQMKFSALADATGGLTIPASGAGGSWIVKLPSEKFADVPENEFSMMTLARLVGINVPAVELVDTASIDGLPKEVESLKGQALSIERFDRLGGDQAVHIEDFAQIFGIYPADKYKKASAVNIVKVLATEGDDDDVREFVRRLTFNTLIGNADMHLKNWSVYYPDRRTARIAPAYDFVSTIAYPGLDDEEAALKFSRTKRFDAFGRDELEHLAGRAGLPSNMVIEAAKETAERFQDVWRTEQKNLPLHQNVIEAIERQLTRVPLTS
jgi:serine/threonine-protein kinase HipA